MQSKSDSKKNNNIYNNFSIDIHSQLYFISIYIQYFQLFNEFIKVQSAFSKINDDFYGNDSIQAQIEQLKECGVELKSNDNILL